MHLLKAYVLIDSTRMVSAKRQVERGSTNINIIARPYFWDICRISTVLVKMYHGTSDRQKLLKMTETGKSRISTLIKTGYFLSLLKFLDLNSDVEFQPYLS